MKILKGIVGILENPATTFSLITLICISVITYHIPSIGGMALATFATVLPAVIAYTDHKQNLANMAISNAINISNAANFSNSSNVANTSNVSPTTNITIPDTNPAKSSGPSSSSSGP